MSKNQLNLRVLISAVLEIDRDFEIAETNVLFEKKTHCLMSVGEAVDPLLLVGDLMDDNGDEWLFAAIIF